MEGTLHRMASCILLPWTVGNRIHLTRSRTCNGRDGKVSAVVLSACLVSMSFGLMVVFLNIPTFRKPSPAIWGLAEMFRITGCVFTIVVSILALRNRNAWLVENNRIDVSSTRKRMFLWLFGFAQILNSTLNMAINIECILEHGKEPFYGEQLLSVLSHIIEIVFCSVQLGFISYFSNYKFLTSMTLNYGIMLMLVANLIIWFHSILTSLISNKVIHSNENGDIYINDCFWSSDLNKFRKIIEPYINPMKTEYSMLAIGFLLRMWTFVDSCRHFEQPNPTEDQSVQDEQSPLLPSINRVRNRNLSLSSENNSRQDLTVLPRGHSESHPISFYICIIVGIFMSLPLLTTSIVFMSDPSDNHRMTFIWEVLRIIFTCEHFILICYAFHVLRKHFIEASKHLKFKAAECIIIISASGAVAFDSFCLITGILYTTDNYYLHHTKSVLIVEFLIDIFGVYMQTVLIIHSGRCRRNSHAMHSSMAANIFLLLHIVNLVRWFLDSFIVSNVHAATKIQHEFFSRKTWSVILEVVFPFTVFYQFHSAMDMYERYKRNC